MSKRVKRVLAIIVLVVVAAGAGGVVYARMIQRPAAPVPADEEEAKEPAVKTDEEEREEPKRVTEKIRVACVGDSITYGAGVMTSRERDSYPAKLAGLLGDGYTVLNFGVSGSTLLSETNKSYRNQAAFKESQEADPDIVLIMLGTNDSKAYNWNAGEYERQLRDFVNGYKELPGSPRVYLMTCCAAFGADGKDVVAFQVNKSVLATEIVAIIKRAAEACDVPVIDIYNTTKEHPGYFVDGVHPNAEGNEVIAETVYKFLKLTENQEDKKQEVPSGSIRKDGEKEVLCSYY